MTDESTKTAAPTGAPGKHDRACRDAVKRASRLPANLDEMMTMPLSEVESRKVFDGICDRIEQRADAANEADEYDRAAADPEARADLLEAMERAALASALRRADAMVRGDDPMAYPLVRALSEREEMHPSDLLDVFGRAFGPFADAAFVDAAGETTEGAEDE